MLKTDVDHLVLSLQHLLHVDLGWCSRFVNVVRGLVRFSGVFVVITLGIGNGVLVSFDDFASAIRVVLNFCVSSHSGGD